MSWCDEKARQESETTEDFLEVLQVVFCKAISSEGVQVDFARTAIKDAFSLHKICVPAADTVPLPGWWPGKKRHTCNYNRAGKL